ncbi:BT4734/BF3469 family protein [Sphingobacterium spiritivorum]|uniref:BT4734/BF3469 family protein n=1 Tax=Sphingobacterium spiritivorum TaxID=258 RepID=UPI003DA494EE
MPVNYTFSFYNGPIRNVKPFREVGLKEAIDIIRSERFADDVIRLRNCTEKSTRKAIKDSLPYFTFSGTFTKRLNDALKNHSGLIVLDFDDLPDDIIHKFKHDFVSVDLVCATFLSPSGNGLKVIVKTSDNLDSFTDIASYQLAAFNQVSGYFEDNFNIAADPSGKDVARACFVSYDPEVIYNPSSEVYFVKPEAYGKLETKQTSIIPEPSADYEDQFKKNKDLLRVKYVVEQIEQKQIDITDNDYDNRLTVGFALASLGEQARPYYIRAVQYNDNDEDPDKKFNDALAKGKFKTPAKFFSLAKDFGLEVKLPRTIEEAKKKAEVRDIIQDEKSVDDYEAYGIWLNSDTGTYWGLDLKNVRRELSNFKMRILFHVTTSAEEAYRLIQIKNIFGLDKVIQINTDDFVSAGTFKKVIARQGNYLWKGQDFDLVRLQDMLQRHERTTKSITQLGYYKRGNLYSFANGIYDLNRNEFLSIDEYGIVETLDNDGNEINYFLPALSKMFVDKEDMFDNDKKFIYQTSSVDYQTWVNQFVRVFGKNGYVGLLFYFVAIYSDIVYSGLRKRLPIPFAYGKRGSGKGTMIEALMKLFGEGQDQVMLGGASTTVGFMRKLAQFVNAMTWLDEYKNNLPFKMIESFKNIYDRKGYERGKKDNSFATESTPIKSLVWMSGQEMPTAEPALFTRVVLLHFKETHRSDSDRQEFRKLGQMEKMGISHITVHMLKHRSFFEENFQEVYELTLKEFAAEVNSNDVDERLLSSYSMLIATYRIINQVEPFPFSIDEFKKVCMDLLKNQVFILKGSDDTSKFWQVVETLVSTGWINEGTHYLLRDGYLDIFIQDIYHLYNKQMQERKEVNILDKPTLENYLQSDTVMFIAKKKMKIGKKYSWAMRFKYSELNIDLIRGDNETDLKQKYQEMGVAYEEDDSSKENFNEGFSDAIQVPLDFSQTNN